MSADLTKREVCKQSQQQLKTPMIPGDETILIPIVANFFATGGYTMSVAYMSAEREREFIWEVDDLLAKRAQCFIQAFNELFDENIPNATPENAHTYWYASDKSQTIIGRCVRIGSCEKPMGHYHWAIDLGDNHELVVKDFWNTDVWTTAQYRQQLGDR